MAKTASASVGPCTCAMPQSSRVMVTRDASAFHRPSSGGAAAVRRTRRGRNATAWDLRIRQCLLGFAPARKQLRSRTVEQLVHVADAEMVPAVVFLELFPGDWSGHGCAFPPARRVRHHRGCSALVTKPVEEDAPLALFLADVGREPGRLNLCRGSGEALGEALHRAPIGRAVKRDDDVDALAAGQHREALELQLLEHIADAHSRVANVLEIEPLIGIEVEHQAIGIFDLVDLAAPAVELDRPHLDAGEEPADVVEEEIVFGVPILLADWDVLDVRVEGARVVFLEEALGGGSLGIPD